jgi:hypothetical protein
MDENEREPDAVVEFLRVLEERGVPEGAWLIQIAQVRDALHAADELMRRLERAVIRSARHGSQMR